MSCNSGPKKHKWCSVPGVSLAGEPSEAQFLQTPALGSEEAGETKVYGLQSSGVWSEFQELEMRRKGRRNVALWVLNL